MRIRTRLFDLQKERGWSDRKLAADMGISDAQVSRVRNGERSINHDFIVGAFKAFPEKAWDDLFYLEGSEVEPEPAATETSAA